MNPDNIEAIAEVTFLGELLEREIEKEKYRPFLRSMAKCSIRSNWYSGIKTLWQSSSHQPSRPNPKRVQSTSSTSAEPSAKRITTSGVEKSSGPKKPVPHRAIIHSDNEDSDDKDDDYSVPSVSDSKKHRGSEADEHKPVVKSKPSSDSHPTIHVKPSIQSKSSSERPPKVSSSIKIRSISSSEQSLKEALQRHLDVLIKEPKYNLFVDPVPREYEDYYMIIQSPICLRDIQLKLQENEYRSVSKFKKDMLLLIGNCVYYNMLLTPAAPTTAYALGAHADDPIKMYLGDIYTVSVNMAGLPGMVVPCGFDAGGMPVGAQLIGPAFGEGKLFAAAHAYQLHTDFHKRYPEMGKEG